MKINFQHNITSKNISKGMTVANAGILAFEDLEGAVHHNLNKGLEDDDTNKSVVSIMRNSEGKYLTGISNHEDDRLGREVFPGGSIKIGEQLSEALFRETKEESGLDIDGIEKVFRIGTMPNIYFILCSAEGNPIPNEEFDDLSWKLPTEILNNTLESNALIINHLEKCSGGFKKIIKKY